MSAVNLTEWIGSLLVPRFLSASLKISSASISYVPGSVALAENVSLPFDLSKGILSSDIAFILTSPASVLKLSLSTVTPSGIVSATVKSVLSR